MKYVVSVLAKIVLFPVVLVMLIPAYGLFIISPDMHKFTFKMGK